MKATQSMQGNSAEPASMKDMNSLLVFKLECRDSSGLSNLHVRPHVPRLCLCVLHM